jgi:hypothetical protein
MNMADGPPQSMGGLVGVGVGAGVSVGAIVEVGVIDAVAVAVGGSILSKAPQLFTTSRSIIQQSTKTILLKR